VTQRSAEVHSLRPSAVVTSRPYLDALERIEIRRRARAAAVRRSLIVADILGLSLAFALALSVYGSRSSATNALVPAAEFGLFMATVPAWLVLAKLIGLYDQDEKHTGHSTVDDVLPIVTLVTFGSWLLYAGSSLTGFATPYSRKLVLFWFLAILFVIAARIAARAHCRRRRDYLQNMLVVGAGQTEQLLARKLEDHPEYGVRLVGFVDEQAAGGNQSARVLGRLEDLPDIVAEHEIERVLIAYPSATRQQTADVARKLRDLDVQLDLVPRFVDLVTPSATIYTIEGLPLISLSPIRIDPVTRGLKRAIDILGALVGLFLLAPAFAWIALRIKRDSRGPVFYRHQRAGLHGQPFDLIKFRTMRSDSVSLAELLTDPQVRAEFERSHKIADDPRVTKFGRFLRRLSLDELPQLVNVLRGEMSLVGPRPVTTEELRRYGDEIPMLLAFRPGITGYWQINGRSRTDYEDRVRLDIAYVRGWSLKLDFLILAKTAWVLVTGHGAY
jgi:exopolysaccharide biosynthesis polyprenyl glycosylphosphotransferase